MTKRYSTDHLISGLLKKPIWVKQFAFFINGHIKQSVLYVLHGSWSLGSYFKIIIPPHKVRTPLLKKELFARWRRRRQHYCLLSFLDLLYSALFHATTNAFVHLQGFRRSTHDDLLQVSLYTAARYIVQFCRAKLGTNTRALNDWTFKQALLLSKTAVWEKEGWTINRGTIRQAALYFIRRMEEMLCWGVRNFFSRQSSVPSSVISLWRQWDGPRIYSHRCVSLSGTCSLSIFLC